MFGFAFRMLWRLFIAVVTVCLAYATAFLFFPYLDDRFPVFVSLLIIYLISAYGVIPAIVRMWHLVFKPTHLPHYSVSGDGWSSDPVNIAVVCGNKRQLTNHMKRAGWEVADKLTLRTSLRAFFAIALRLPYPTAPFSNLYMFGRVQDIGFQIQTGSPPSPRSRHHVRFWLLNDDRLSHHHTAFWHDILHLFTRSKRQIWIGTATHDVSAFAFRIRDFKLTHMIDERTDIERDFLIKSLQDAHAIKRSEIIPAGEPVKFRGQTFGVNIVTDGTLHVLQLKK